MNANNSKKSKTIIIAGTVLVAGTIAVLSYFASNYTGSSKNGKKKKLNSEITVQNRNKILKKAYKQLDSRKFNGKDCYAILSFISYFDLVKYSDESSLKFVSECIKFTLRYIFTLENNILLQKVRKSEIELKIPTMERIWEALSFKESKDESTFCTNVTQKIFVASNNYWFEKLYETIKLVPLIKKSKLNVNSVYIIMDSAPFIGNWKLFLGLCSLLFSIYEKTEDAQYKKLYPFTQFHRSIFNILSSESIPPNFIFPKKEIDCSKLFVSKNILCNFKVLSSENELVVKNKERIEKRFSSNQNNNLEIKGAVCEYIGVDFENRRCMFYGSYLKEENEEKLVLSSNLGEILYLKKGKDSWTGKFIWNDMEEKKVEKNCIVSASIIPH